MSTSENLKNAAVRVGGQAVQARTVQEDAQLGGDLQRSCVEAAQSTGHPDCVQAATHCVSGFQFAAKVEEIYAHFLQKTL